MGMWVGNENLDADDAPDPDIDTDSAAYLWKKHHTTFLFGDGTLPTAAGMLNAHFDIDVKAMRRFRENFMTLWFITNVVNAGANSSASVQFKSRTLLRVP